MNATLATSSARVEPVRTDAPVERTVRPRVGTAIRLASAMGFTSQVLDDMKARLDVALQSGKDSFAKSTMGSVQRVAEMTRMTDPVQWPDVPPREIEAGEVLLPLRRQLAESLRADRYQPDLEESDPAGLAASVDDARQRLNGIAEELSKDLETVVRTMFRTEAQGEGESDALRKDVQAALARDPRGAVQEAADVRAEDVLALVR